MHYTTSFQDFEKIKQEVLVKWNLYSGLVKFIKYFTDQWFNSQWTNVNFQL